MSQARRSGNFLFVSYFVQLSEGVASSIVSENFQQCHANFSLLFSLCFLLISVSHSLLLCVSCLVSCRQSIKSSFRDKDKPSRFKDLQTTTRFQVEPQNEESDDDSHDSQEDRELLNDNEYDTKYGKSFRSV